jgi:HK97 family phage portal protein
MSKKSKKASKLPLDPQAESFDISYSIGDPAFAEFLRTSGLSAGEVTERTALGLSAFYRAVALISGTIASLPLKVYRDLGDGKRERVDHFLSTSPAGPMDISAFSWVEMIMVHQLLHAEAYLKAINTEAGELVGLWPIHPMAIQKVSWAGPDKEFEVRMNDGTTVKEYTGDITQVLGMSTDGLRGMSPLELFRRSLKTAQAGELAANNSFTRGALVAGLVTTEEDIDGDEAKTISDSLKTKMTGTDNAGGIAFINRSLKFTPWAMKNTDAQFLESREFAVEDIARMFGMPLNLLSVNKVVSNWGTGVKEANLGLAKYVLMNHTGRIEAALRRLLPTDYFAEFDYKGLLQGSPEDEINLLIAQVQGGLLTVDEARAVLNIPPMPKAEQPVQEQQPNE